MAHIEGDEVISVEEQLDIVRRLGLTPEEVEENPYKLKKAALEYLGGLQSSGGRVEAVSEKISDGNIDEIMKFRSNVRGFLKWLSG